MLGTGVSGGKGELLFKEHKLLVMLRQIRSKELVFKDCTGNNYKGTGKDKQHSDFQEPQAKAPFVPFTEPTAYAPLL